ncbi:MAG: 2-oxo acid dehydrogenase subunit E2, partial [Betaproteobacteria bacterium]
GPVSALESQFYSLPRFVRKIIWFFIRRDPRLFKAVAGTVALTSLPWKIDGRAIGWTISPMTLTLIIAATSKKAVLVDGNAVEREVLQLNFTADHNIIDGAPLWRFIARFKKRLVTDLAVLPPPAAEQPVPSVPNSES